METDGGDCHKVSQPTFPYPVFGRFTYSSPLLTDVVLGFLSGVA